MSFFEKASVSNNQAIEALLGGDHVTAIRNMEMAIKLMRDDLSNSIASISTTSSQSSQPTMMASCCHDNNKESVHIGNSSDYNTRISPLPVHYTTTIEIPRMKSFETIVFNQAIHIPTIKESRADCLRPSSNGDSSHLEVDTTHHFLNDCDKNIYISAAIFNFALTHHYLACLMNCNKAEQVFMKKAINLYNVVLNLLEKTEHFHNPNNSGSGSTAAAGGGGSMNIGSSQKHTVILMKLASMNNLSQIQISQGDYSKAQHGNAEVLKLVEYLQNQVHLLEPRVQSLLLNLLLLRAPTSAGAA